MLSDFKIYRRWKKGKWYLLKPPKVPITMMFCWWTRQPHLYSDTITINVENYKGEKRRIKNEKYE